MEKAVENGDPNNINKVYTEMRKVHMGQFEVIEIAASVDLGIRHLRNYAIERGSRGESLLQDIYTWQNDKNIKSTWDSKKKGIERLGQDLTELKWWLGQAFNPQTWHDGEMTCKKSSLSDSTKITIDQKSSFKCFDKSCV